MLRGFLESVARTASLPDLLEVVLVLDADDAPSQVIDCPGLALRRVIGPPGRTMGQLNAAGYAACSGQWVMLLNDDVTARTIGWDTRFRGWFAAFPDGILLLHVNDCLFGPELCVFPVVSRVFCVLAGDICPRDYLRYRIDDHIEDVFNLLAMLGEKRTIYLPDVLFEHGNHETVGQARRYRCDPQILTLDAGRFDALLPSRKQLAVKLKGHISGDHQDLPAWQRRLETVTDSFSLRSPGRQLVSFRPGLGGWLARLTALARRVGCKGKRLAGDAAILAKYLPAIPWSIL